MTAASLRFAAEQLLQIFVPRHSVSRFTEDGNQPIPARRDGPEISSVSQAKARRMRVRLNETFENRLVCPQGMIIRDAE